MSHSGSLIAGLDEVIGRVRSPSPPAKTGHSIPPDRVCITRRSSRRYRPQTRCFSTATRRLCDRATKELPARHSAITRVRKRHQRQPGATSGGRPHNPEPIARVPRRHLLAIAQVTWHHHARFTIAHEIAGSRLGRREALARAGARHGRCAQLARQSRRGEARPMSRERPLAVPCARYGAGYPDGFLGNARTRWVSSVATGDHSTVKARPTR